MEMRIKEACLRVSLYSTKKPRGALRMMHAPGSRSYFRIARTANSVGGRYHGIMHDGDYRETLYKTSHYANLHFRVKMNNHQAGKIKERRERYHELHLNFYLAFPFHHKPPRTLPPLTINTQSLLSKIHSNTFTSQPRKRVCA